jgi:hypothetical protein
MFSDSLLDDPVMHLQQPQGAGFIAAHLAAEADDVGEHDGGQAPSLGLNCAAGVFFHERIMRRVLPGCQMAREAR